MADDENLTRLNCTIPDKVNEQLNSIIPHGMKSDVIRKLMELYIQASSTHGRSILMRLLDGEVELCVKRTNGT